MNKARTAARVEQRPSAVALLLGHGEPAAMSDTSDRWSTKALVARERRDMRDQVAALLREGPGHTASQAPAPARSPDRRLYDSQSPVLDILPVAQQQLLQQIPGSVFGHGDHAHSLRPSSIRPHPERYRSTIDIR
jgi:hypothetical protein